MAKLSSVLFLSVIMSFYVAAAAPIVSTNALEKRRSGIATWFRVGLGNCGWQSVDTDWIVALPTSVYGNGEHCGKKVIITDDNNNTGTAVVVDSCPSCPDSGDLDLSPSLFSFFKPQSDGTFKISWRFADENGN